MPSQRWLRHAFWAALAVTFVVAIWPRPLHVPGEPSDKVQHIFAFATLTALALAAYGRASFLRILTGLVLFGAFIEVAQSVPGLHRDAELLDWVADVAAVAAVFAIAAAWRRFRKS